MQTKRIQQLRRYGTPLLGIAAVLILWLLVDLFAVFIHLPSLLLTVGGTAVVTFISFPSRQLRGVVVAIREAASMQHSVSGEIDQVKILAQHHRLHGIAGLEELARNVENSVLQRGIQLLTEWKPIEELRTALEGEHIRTVTHYEDCRRILLTIGKLLPAFGLIGTLVSLVLLLRQSADLTAEGVGPALSLAILTTLYGAVLANAVVLPFEAKLQMFIEHLRIRFEIGVRAIQLISDQAPPSLIEEQLACFTAVDEKRYAPAAPGESPVAHEGVAG